MPPLHDSAASHADRKSQPLVYSVGPGHGQRRHKQRRGIIREGSTGQKTRGGHTTQFPAGKVVAPIKVLPASKGQTDRLTERGVGTKPRQPHCFNIGLTPAICLV